MRKRTILWSALAVAVLLTIAYAAERQDFPEDFAGPPLYGNATSSADDGWAAYAFFRDPDAIPDNTNLGAVDPGARSYALTVSGYVIRSSPPPSPPDVFHVEDEEGMPIWLLSNADFQDALDDGVLTIAELESADSLVKGVASQYVLHQSVKDPNTYVVTADGTLADGRSFKIKLVWKDEELLENSITVD